MRRLIAALAVTVVAATPRSAFADMNPPAVSLRPFLLVTEQSFAAKQSFKAIFGQSAAPFVGGGVELVLHDRFYIDLAASRFQKTGQRAFLFNGQAFGLGLPLTVTETPFEVSGGYRFLPRHRINPYVGVGFGSYGYKETSESSSSDENVDTRHAGFLVSGGAEFRLHRWVSVTADVQYTRISGILGSSGISKDAGESDLGGVAARFKVLVGR